MEEVAAGPRHLRPLSAFRVAVAGAWLLSLALTAGVFLMLLAPPAILLLRPLSLRAYRTFSSFFFGCWLAQIAWHCEKVS